MKKDTRDESALIAGVDLGDRWSRYCVLDPKSQVLDQDSVATTGESFGNCSATGPRRPW